MRTKLEVGWHKLLAVEMAKPYFAQLEAFLVKEHAENQIVYPPEPLIFSAFTHTPFDKVRVVIIGQDPYHGPGQAHGLSFSVPCGIPLPPSLKNIFLELQRDEGVPFSNDGCLISWAKQGVLLLNATLTVRAEEPKSHHGKGWEHFTDAVVDQLVQRSDPIVFVLWGKSAQEKLGRIVENKESPHAVLMSAHPSPLSAYQGFFGSCPFSKINGHLARWGKAPINWQPGCL
jgi:uracil-DNA glycosylase